MAWEEAYDGGSVSWSPSLGAKGTSGKHNEGARGGGAIRRGRSKERGCREGQLCKRIRKREGILERCVGKMKKERREKL